MRLWDDFYTRGMTADDLLVIATFINNIDAELARGALEAAGIESLIRADDCGGTRPHMWMGGIELLVRGEDVDGRVRSSKPSRSRWTPLLRASGSRNERTAAIHSLFDAGQIWLDAGAC